MTIAYLNRIATAVPPHDIHGAFVRFARTLFEDRRALALFDRMVDKAQIAHRFSVLPPSATPEGPSVDAARFYARERFPSTGERMRRYEEHAPGLAERAVAGLDLGSAARRVSHVIVTSCTGMYAPGLDLDLVERCGLDPSVERTTVGFMGCYAAINGLKLARHIVRSTPASRVLLVNLELCSLHLQPTQDLEKLLSFLVFGDGCAASLVSADPTGLALDRFHAVLLPETRGLITWNIRDLGFDMLLSGRVPGVIRDGLRDGAAAILDGAAPASVDHWAVHPGGRSVLDAVEQGLGLAPTALTPSRCVLARFGNMSSATVMFVLQAILAAASAGERGCAMSFGPGLTAESMLFHRV
uniref:Type III polyketide synthase n=1 Tax=Aetherobacter rufus TaxID=888831 RepID=A0A3Q8I1L3_9BACT|nr:type III polyketide synthase [Aetherobacter rufus]